MKTVMTIVLDEDKHMLGWRVDRNESVEVLKELSSNIIEDVYRSGCDSLEEHEPIADYFLDIVSDMSNLPKLKEQLEPYKLHNLQDHTMEVL